MGAEEDRETEMDEQSTTHHQANAEGHTVQDPDASSDPMGQETVSTLRLIVQVFDIIA